jgi:hypothetical protein
MSLSNAYQEPSQHSDQSSILFGEEALCENQGGASMSGADFHANAAPAPQGALESNQRAPVVSRGRTSELLFVDPSGRAVEGRRVIVELSRLWPKRSPPPHPFYHSPRQFIGRAQRTSQTASSRTRLLWSRLFARCHRIVAPGGPSKTGMPDMSLFLNFGQRSLSLTHDNLFSVRGGVTILS